MSEALDFARMSWLRKYGSSEAVVLVEILNDPVELLFSAQVKPPTPILQQVAQRAPPGRHNHPPLPSVLLPFE